MEKLIYVLWAAMAIKWGLIIGAVVLATMLVTGFIDISFSIGLKP